MQVVILAGGSGSRIQALTGNAKPKALLKIAGASILEIQIASLPSNASVMILIGAKHFYSQFADEVEYLSQKYNLKIRIISEGESLGTGGALRKVEGELEKSFLVLMGDVLFSDDLSASWLNFISKSADIGVVIRETNHPEDSDLVELTPNGKLKSISKYPHEFLKQDGNYYGMTGIYMLSSNVIKEPLNKGLKDLTQILARSVRDGYKSVPIHGIGIFRDIGTVERFAQAEVILDQIQKRRMLPVRDVLLLDKDDTLMVDKNPAEPIKFSDVNWKLVKECKREYHDAIHWIVTNQPGLAKGQFTEENLVNQIDSLQKILAQKNFIINDFRYCPHHPQKGFPNEIAELKINCKCRKPLPGMVVSLLNSAEFRPNRVTLYGDSFRDRILGDALGIEFKWAFKGNFAIRSSNIVREWIKYRRAV